MRTLHPALAMLLAAATVACTNEGQVLSSPAAPTAANGTEAKPPGDLAVTTVIENVDSTGLPADLSNDGLGPYVNGAGGVRSVLAANAFNNLTFGDWQFGATSATGRKVGHSLDPDDAIQPGDPAYLVPSNPPFWGTQVVPAQLQVMCTQQNHSMLAMAAGASFTCGLLDHHIMFNGSQYGRPMAPLFTGFPETTDAQVTCNAANAGGCSDWFIDPIGRGRAISRLMLHVDKPPNAPNIHIGSFYVRFRIHITRP